MAALDWQQLVLDQLRWHWEAQLRPRLTGLSDEEYFWEPVADCWSVRPRGQSSAPIQAGSGAFTIDFAIPEPDPPPVTTIAWRLGHLGGMAVGGFASRRFGDGTLTTARIRFPASAGAVPGFLGEHYRAWRAGLAGLSPPEWTAPLGPAWGPYAESDTVDLALHVLDEVIHHGAEVGLLRDLYAARASMKR